MLVVLLVGLLRVGADWVEIAQNDYRRNPSRKGPVTTESYSNYPNVTVSGPSWHRGYANKVGDVRRVPSSSPARGVDAGAVNKQESYDIDGPDEVSIHDELTSHGGTDLPIHTERNIYRDVKRPAAERTTLHDKYQKLGHRGDQDKDRDIARDHFHLHNIMRHFVDTLSKPNKEYNEEKTDTSRTKVVEPDEDNTTEFSSEKPNQWHSQEGTVIPDVSLNNNKYLTGIWRMLKMVGNVISKNTHRSVSSKIKYLEDLKQKLLYNIQERIDTVWPGAGRAGRTEARGHVELPSSEGALMTISFLTFAVFLIKLVLQIIHTYKNKTMMTPAVVTAVGRAAATLTKN